MQQSGLAEATVDCNWDWQSNLKKAAGQCSRFGQAELEREVAISKHSLYRAYELLEAASQRNGAFQPQSSREVETSCCSTRRR